VSPDPYLRKLAEHGFEEPDAPRFLALWDRLEAEYLERIVAAAAPFARWRDRFRATATETARLVEDYKAEARFLAVDTLAAGELGRRRQRELGARLAEMLDSARTELPDPNRVPQVTASWVLALFFDRIYRRCATPGGPDLPSQVPELMFLAVSAYFGTEAGLEELTPPP
jgi:hypothetical protein